MVKQAFGIDVGGSGVKGCLVDLKMGKFIGERVRIPTPRPATPKAVAEVCGQVMEAFNVPKGMPVGLTVPAPVKHNIALFIANLDPSWGGTDVCELMKTHTGHSVTALNDADAAGYAEVMFGAAKGVKGTVIVTTLGTGIGTALVHNGMLVPNTELGHIELDGYDYETQASSGQRTKQGLSYPQWAERLQRYYSHLEMLFSPDLFVVGGGVSRDHDKFLPLLDLKTPIIPAALRNEAGIIGAATLAAQAAKTQAKTEAKAAKHKTSKE
ncbi:MAG: ROK family protein [Actinomycetaceae bacterium]|nr:ROK family protein [Actinomycetaceae bacterium]